MENQLIEMSKVAASDVEFECSGVESNVQVAGSWNKWRPHNLVFNPRDSSWSLSLKLRPGCYQYKYIIDGEWIHDPSKAWQDDGKGNINNVINRTNANINISIAVAIIMRFITTTCHYPLANINNMRSIANACSYSLRRVVNQF